MMVIRTTAMKLGLMMTLAGILSATAPAIAQQTPPSLPTRELPTPPANANGEDNQQSSAIIVLPPNVRPAVDLNDNPAARARIAEMLQRAQQNLQPNDQAASPSDQPHSADPILNDVLDVIRRRGSVLDGSSLDEAAGAGMTQSQSESYVVPMHQKPDADRRYQAAESLLRSARLLQQLGNSDPEQAQLIRAMRHRAMALMIQSAANEPSAQPFDLQRN